MITHQKVLILAAVLACVLAKILLTHTGSKKILHIMSVWLKEDEDIINP